jgi:hypothetical protein
LPAIDVIFVIRHGLFVCRNLSELPMVLCACCSERVRDVLVAMWDRKTMGDMPKMAKNLFAAASAQRAAAAAAARAAAVAKPSKHQPQQQQPLLLQPQQQRSKPRSHSRPQFNRVSSDHEVSSDHDDSDFEHTGATSDSSFGLSDLENERGINIRKRLSGGRPPSKRPRAPISSDAKNRQVRNYTSSGRGSEKAASQQAYRWQARSSRRHVDDLPAPSGMGLQQWLHPGQLGVQQPRTAMQRVPASQPGICTHAPLQLPQMPRAPR